MQHIVNQEGYPYSFDESACSTCQGRCCTGESGYIYVNKSEIQNISDLLNLDINEFTSKYLYKKGYKYSIKEHEYNDSYECVFYDRNSNGCNIYNARPNQCKTFPFWDYYKTRVEELKLECSGIFTGNENV